MGCQIPLGVFTPLLFKGTGYNLKPNLVSLQRLLCNEALCRVVCPARNFPDLLRTPSCASVNKALLSTPLLMDAVSPLQVSLMTQNIIMAQVWLTFPPWYPSWVRAAAELVSRLRQALRRLSQHRASWDERVAFFQWVMRGTISYVPLVGLPSPLELHHLDTAFQNLVLSGMGVRSTVERMSLLAAKRNGGMQIPSVVESLLAATSADLIVLLSGSTTASVLARDALHEAMFSPPAQADSLGGMVVLAIRLLAHYGLHINVPTDRFLSRVLDALPCPSQQPLVGPFRAAAASPSLTLARVGFVANTLRCILQSWTEEGRPTPTWPDAGLWAQALPIAFPFSSSQCSAAVNDALAKSRLDWTIECSLFRPLLLSRRIGRWRNGKFLPWWCSGCLLGCCLPLSHTG